MTGFLRAGLSGGRHQARTIGMLYRALGLWGTVKVVAAKLLGARQVQVRPIGVRDPVLVRMNNCDLPLLADIFCSDECVVDLPWTPGTIFDLGANIGLTAIKFRQQFPQAGLVAVEPDSGTAAICRTNLAGFDRVTVVQAAVGYGQKTVRCVNPQETAICYQFADCAPDDKDAVRALTITELVALASDKEGPCRTPIFIKMDIEGSEIECFDHAADWLDKVQAILVEPHGAGTGERIHSRLLQSGFDVRMVGEKILGLQTAA